MIRLRIIYSNGAELCPSFPADAICLHDVASMIGPTAVFPIEIIAVEVISIADWSR